MPSASGNPKSRMLDAFEAPSSYRFEAELQETPPRHVPEEFRKSPYFARQRNSIVGLLLTGVLCVAFGKLPILKELGLYVVPLAYLSWIGLGSMVLGACAWVSSRVRRGPVEYVEEGIPLVARIREVVLRPMVLLNGQATAYGFSAAIEYRDPETGTLMERRVDSRTFSASAKGNYRTSYRVGDYVTAVYLKSNPVKTLRLYGFLEFRPELGLLRAEAAQPTSLPKLVLAVSGLFALFGVLFWNVYAFARFEPLDLTFAQIEAPMGVGGLVLGGGLLTWLALRQARLRRELAARNEKALAAGEAVELESQRRGMFGAHGILLTLIIVFGAIALGGAVVLCWCCTANALLDKSKPEFRPVEIVEFWQTTHSFLFREYEIEYRFPREQKTRKLVSSPTQMRQFLTKRGAAEVYAGRFGWSWIKSIVPAQAPDQAQPMN